MSSFRREWRIEDLPASLPVFPLSGVLLLPRTRLPLNIFEPRYLNMVHDALAGDGLIGMTQPCTPTAPGTSPTDPAAIYPTGCAGAVTASSDTPDGRILITITGVARFGVRSELPTIRGYRRITADWQPFAADLGDPAAPTLDRARLFKGLEAFFAHNFAQNRVTLDWDALASTSDETLINSLAMICPFAPNEKQALLEAPDLDARGRIVIALLEMAALRPAPEDGTRH